MSQGKKQLVEVGNDLGTPWAPDVLDAFGSQIMDRQRQEASSGSSDESRAKEQTRLAPNIIKWIMEPGFLQDESLPIKIRPRQFEILRDLYELLCPFCNDVGEVKDCWAMSQEDLGAQILLEHDTCPKCGVTRVDLDKDGLLHNYQEIVLVAGYRSGKSSMVGGMQGTYELHRLLYMDEPWRVYDLLPDQELQIPFVASSGGQSQDTIWSHFRACYGNSPWLQDCARRERVRGGQDMVADKSIGKVEFKRQHVKAVAMHSNSGTLAGRARPIVFLDELAQFEQSTSKRSAHRVYNILTRSLRDVRSKADRMREEGDYIPSGLMVVTSTQGYVGDKLNELEEMAEHDRRAVFYCFATWEFNPDIAREDLDEEFDRDPQEAARDYGSVALGAIEPFLDSPTRVDACVVAEKFPVLETREVQFVEQGKGGSVRYLKHELVDCMKDRSIPRILCCDPGRSGDSFAILLMHKDGTGDEAILVVDAVIEIRPIPQGQGRPGAEVHFESADKLVFDILDHFHITTVAYDRWNSVRATQSLRKRVKVVEYNIDRDDYLDFRVSLYRKRMSFLPAETRGYGPLARGRSQAKLLHETKTLEDSGKRVDHGSRGTNDLVCCLVQGHRILIGSTATISKSIAERTVNELPNRIVRFGWGATPGTMSGSVFSGGTRHPQAAGAGGYRR